MAIEDLRDLYKARRLDEAWALYLGTPGDAEWHLYGALVAWTRQENQDLYAARIAVERAFQFEPTAGVRVRCHFVYGMIVREIGDLRLATEQLETCLRLLPVTPELLPVLKGPALYNLAMAYGDWGLQEKSLVLFESAATEFLRENLSDYLRRTLQNLAWIALDFNQLDRAIQAIGEAEPLCDTEDAQHKQIVLQAYLCEKQGQYSEALLLCERIRNAAEIANDTLAFAATVAARVLLQRGFPEQARTVADIAITLSLKKPHDHRIMRRANAVYFLARNARVGG